MPVLGTRRIRLYLVSSLSRMDAAELPNTGSESVRIFAKAAFLPFLLGIDFGMALLPSHTTLGEQSQRSRASALL